MSQRMTGRDDSVDHSAGLSGTAAPERSASDLRKRAEAKARASEANAADTPSPAESKRLLHELRVHQIELEMQNEELRQAQDALGASRTRYFELYDLAPVGYLTLNEAGLILEASLTAATLLGVARGALVQQPLTRFILSADQDAYYRHRKQLFETRAPQQCEVRMLRGDAAPLWVALRAAAAQDTDGSPVFRAVMVDITERKQAEQTLRHSEERFRLLFEQAADSIFLLDIVPDGIPVIRDTNSAALRLLGYEREELIGQPLTLIEPTHDIAKLADARRQGILSGARIVFEASHRCKDGTIREFECSAAEIQIGSETFAISVERDVTGRKQAEAERESMATQLRQAQKMEAVGQLAGGMAHDFNNALTVILGFSELASRQLNPLDPLHHHMNEIMRAVDKSANLTRQLLAFARRQIVTLRVLDLNAAIASLANMLPRLIGEDIELRIAPSAGLWNLYIDPSQVDQILMNLVTNARDAIADTGRITIETANVALGEEHCRRHPDVVPGDYVALTVSDTGVGMDKATLERIFDPFFTTKPEGKGTGLGLATVYGVAKQSGGFVHVCSEPGHGTMFRVYLPRFVGDAEQPAPKKQPATLRGTETVLIVEDEPLLLELIQEGLHALGYNVLTAGAPGDAILLCETYAKDIQVLVSDVVMPMMNGRELQQRLERVRPGLRTIFMSGYTADMVAHRGIVEERMPFVQKPFTVEALAGKIREVLED